MTRGLLVVKFDQSVGVRVVASYPPFDPPPETLLTLYGFHVPGDHDGEGLVGFDDGKANLLSVPIAEGENGPAALLVAKLEPGESPDEFQDAVTILAEALRHGLATEPGGSLAQLLADALRTLAPERETTAEAAVGTFLLHEPTRELLLRLLKKGVAYGPDLTSELAKVLGHRLGDVDSVLLVLRKRGIVTRAFVPGHRMDHWFVTAEPVLLRAPPAFLESPDRVERLESEVSPRALESYLQETRSFFANYEPSFEDALKLARLLSDRSATFLLDRLRSGPLRRAQLEGATSADPSLEVLVEEFKEADLLHEGRDEGGEFLLLMSDPFLLMAPPAGLASAVREVGASLEPGVVRHYLKLLLNVQAGGPLGAALEGLLEKLESGGHVTMDAPEVNWVKDQLEQPPALAKRFQRCHEVSGIPPLVPGAWKKWKS